MKQIKGSDLTQEQQADAKRMFIHRFTGEHRPDWAQRERPAEMPYKPQFVDDQDWLNNTLFWVTKSGHIANGRPCVSSPTWPRGRGGFCDA